MDIPALLEAKGIEYIVKGVDELAIVCPNALNHQGSVDSTPSFNISTSKEVAACFSCGYKLGVEGMQKWLLGDVLDEDQMQCLTLRGKLKRIQNQPEEALFIEEAEFETYMPPGKPWDREYRGISVETYRKLGAIECQRGRYENRICFPISQHGRLLGVDARALGEEKPKYLRPRGCNAKEWLYPFDLAKQKRVKRVILCEGIFHSIRLLSEVGRPEALCYFGAQNWSEHKTLLLLELAPQEVIFWPDNDKAGIEAMNKICPQLTDWFEIFFIPPEVLPTGRDLGDFSKGEIIGFLEQKRRWK